MITLAVYVDLIMLMVTMLIPEYTQSLDWRMAIKGADEQIL